jgi:uncharacterized protein YbjQ (UPF0145 family)
MIVVTTETIPGRTIYQVIGEVMGVTARAANAFTEGVKVLSGPSRPPMPYLVRWRRDAIREMIDEATRLGADAIIGMKFDTRQITASWSEICAYGTAVRLTDSPLQRRSQHAGPGHHAGRIPRHQVS